MRLGVTPIFQATPSMMKSGTIESPLSASADWHGSTTAPTDHGVQLQFTPATFFDPITTCISWAICGLVMLVCAANSRDCLHWFVIPVFACGVLIAHDGVNWIRGRFDPFDPVGLLGVYGVHFFFVAPLLHVVWHWWLVTPDIRPEDLRPGWVGWHA